MLTTSHTLKLHCAFCQGLNPYNISSLNDSVFEVIKTLFLNYHHLRLKKEGNKCNQGGLCYSSFLLMTILVMPEFQKSHQSCHNAADASIKKKIIGKQDLLRLSPAPKKEGGRKNACSEHGREDIKCPLKITKVKHKIFALFLERYLSSYTRTKIQSKQYFKQRSQHLIHK